MRGCGGHGGVRARLSRSRCPNADVAVVRRDRDADPRRGEGADRAGLALPDGQDVRGLRANAPGCAGTAGGPRAAGCVVPDRAPSPGCRTEQAAGRDRRGWCRMKIGRIGYINCAPVYGAIDRRIVALPPSGALVTGTPADLNDLLVPGELDGSVISAIEYARHAKELVLLSDLAISCDGPVRSVALFAKQPGQELTTRTVLLSASSRTSVALLNLLCRDVWHIKPKCADARAEAQELEALAALPHEAVLVIGDAALKLAATRPYRPRYDLGEEWTRGTGKPFAFAVWAARRSADPAAVQKCHRTVLASRA